MEIDAMDTVTFPELAETMGVPVTRVHQLIKDGALIAVRDAEGVRRIPAGFVQDGQVVKHLPAVIRLLRDAKFSDADIVDWLHRADDTLPGTPVDALRANRATEVKRRAQTAGY